MAQDPVSAVASWLTPAAPGEVAEDPVIALIAEAARLDALSLAATNRGDQIFSTLPEDVRKGRMRVSFSKLGDVLQRHNGFTSEADLQEWVRVHRNWAMVLVRSDVKKGRISAEDLAAEEAEFDREIGLDQALAQLRAGQAEIKAIREASGCEAHFREAEDLARRAGEVGNQIRNTKPVTLTGAIAMLEWGHENGCYDEDEDEHLHLTNRLIAGLRDMQPVASRISPGDGQIRDLFRKWVDGRRAASAIEDEDETEKILGPVDEAEDTIVSIPATGAAGLAVKAYFYLFFEDIWYVSDCAALSGRATDETRRQTSGSTQTRAVKGHCRICARAGAACRPVHQGIASRGMGPEWGGRSRPEGDRLRRAGGRWRGMSAAAIVAAAKQLTDDASFLAAELFPSPSAGKSFEELPADILAMSLELAYEDNRRPPLGS
jgi:hypothetical protein